MRVVFLRHGQTDYNAELRIQGQVDIPLNETGLQQAREAAASIERLHPTHVISSDLSRAFETAKAVAGDLEITSDPLLRERGYGPWEGLTRPEIEESWPSQFATWRAGGEPGEGIETKADVGSRVASCVESYAQSLGEADTLLVVSHGAAITNAITTMIGVDPASQSILRGLDNCHHAILRSQNQRTPGWSIVGYNLW